jgi:hypothetical protein
MDHIKKFMSSLLILENREKIQGEVMSLNKNSCILKVGKKENESIGEISN